MTRRLDACGHLDVANVGGASTFARAMRVAMRADPDVALDADAARTSFAKCI